jgi:hypothetical protein
MLADDTSGTFAAMGRAVVLRRSAVIVAVLVAAAAASGCTVTRNLGSFPSRGQSDSGALPDGDDTTNGDAGLEGAMTDTGAGAAADGGIGSIDVHADAGLGSADGHAGADADARIAFADSAADLSPFDAAGDLGVDADASAGDAVAAGVPRVDFVSPHVAYLGEQLGVVIRGAGFSGADAVMFGDQPAASMQVKSDTEIRAVPPMIGAASRQPVTVRDALGRYGAGADLVVRAHPIYGYTALTTGVGFQDRTVIYDAERDAVFSYCSFFGNYSATTPSTINRYVYDQTSGAWSMTSSYVPSLYDIAMSPDGKYLIALGTSRLWLLDPVNFSTLGFVDLTQTGLGTAGQLGVSDDGKVLIRDYGVAYSLVTKTFAPAAFPAGIGIVFSIDGSRGVVGDANTSDTIPLSIYDASTGLISPSQTLEYFQLPSMDRTGARYFAGGNLRDQDLVLIGGVPTFLGYMPPDGKHAYDVDSANMAHIRAFDLSGNGPSFQRLDDVVIPDALETFWLRASLDSRYLFIPGPNKFVVVPLPP